MAAADGRKILALIPARGGSKGIPGKNIRHLAGRPLICWTIDTALATSVLDRIIVTTDDREIAAIARQAGADVPFLRPAELARDETTDMPVYHHALQWLADEERYLPDIVVWLRPTAPLRIPVDIEQAVARLLTTGADWIRSICPVEHHPYWMYRLEDDRLQPFQPGLDTARFPRRQTLPPVYRLNGAVEVTWCRTILKKQLLYSGDVRGYIMPPERSIDIDTMIDFLTAEALLAGRKA